MRALNHEKKWALVPINKTNRWLPVKVDDCKDWMHKHMGDKCKIISQSHKRLTQTYEEANVLLSKLGNLMNEGESQFIES